VNRAQRRKAEKKLPKGGCGTYVAPDPVARLRREAKRRR